MVIATMDHGNRGSLGPAVEPYTDKSGIATFATNRTRPLSMQPQGASSKQSKTKPNNTKQNQAKQNQAKQHTAKQSEAKQSTTEQRRARQSKAEQSKTKQNGVKRSKAKQRKSKAQQSTTTQNTTMCPRKPEHAIFTYQSLKIQKYQNCLTPNPRSIRIANANVRSHNSPAMVCVAKHTGTKATSWARHAEPHRNLCNAPHAKNSKRRKHVPQRSQPNCYHSQNLLAGKALCDDNAAGSGKTFRIATGHGNRVTNHVCNGRAPSACAKSKIHNCQNPETYDDKLLLKS